MILARTLALVPAEQRPLLPRFGAAMVAAAVAEAAAYVLLVPLLRALLVGDNGTAAWWLSAMTVAVAVAAVASYAQSLLGLRIGVGMLRGLSRRVGEHLNALPLGWFDRRPTTSVAGVLVGDVREVLGVFAHLATVFVGSLLVPMATAVGILLVDWRLGLAFVVAFPVLFGVHLAAGRSYRAADRAVHEAADEANGRLVEFAVAQPTLRSFGAVGSTTRTLDESLRGLLGASARRLAAGIPGLVAFAFAVQLGFLALVYLLTVRFTDGQLSAASMVALIVVVARFVDPLDQLGQVGATVRSAGDAVDRIVDLLAEPAIVDPEVADAPADWTLEFDGVGFAYDRDPTAGDPTAGQPTAGQPPAGDPTAGAGSVLHDVSFTARAATITAIVGPSGAGKTTLLQLAARFRDPTSGTIRLGGCDLRRLDLDRVMAAMSPVFQDVYLFDTSIAENVRFGRPGATAAEVAEAARLSALDEVVERLPEGWATRVGDRGSRLSGGERQRVAIARALLKDAPIVLLDEVTSALDPHNEGVVVDGIRRLTRDKTVLVVAHKLSTVVDADQILVLDGGTIAERGDHEELAVGGGRYEEFVEQRRSAGGWRVVSG
ncbi:MAG: ABC transporter ATP-binding protein [Actinomycetota bacterium]